MAVRKSQVRIGGVYWKKVSGKRVKVRIDAVSSLGGWQGTNLTTGRTIRVKSAAGLRIL